MTLFLIGSDVYALRAHLKKKKLKTLSRLPFFSVVIPAHNEEKNIIRCLKSVLHNSYPQNKIEIVVVDDGSTDQTPRVVESLISQSQVTNVRLIKQPNQGKAHALNKGMKSCRKGKLIMCIDADSCLHPDALLNAARYFQDDEVVALAANIKIINDGTLLNLIQQFEYLICYQMKRVQTLFNVEYIIGGIGSVFRKSILDKVDYYDTNTVTEDIDLTMKILQRGNRKHRVVYGADVIAYTESVLDIRGLIKQRFRWKWGRCQTFLKNKNMFFSGDKRFTKYLTSFYLPFAIFCDLAFLLEPLLVSYIFYISVRYLDSVTLISALTVITTYIWLNIWAEGTLKIQDKIKYTLIAPTMYFLFYVLSMVEYIALVKSLIKMPRLKESIEENVCHWEHVARLGGDRNFQIIGQPPHS